MHTLTILHVSDLHVRGDGRHPGDRARRRRVLGQAWECNLAEIREHSSIDLVCLTGDIAFAGQEVEYQRATDFIDEMLAALGLDRSRLFLVPGNHDIDRDIEGDAWRRLRGLGYNVRQDLSRWLAHDRGDFGGLTAQDRDAVAARQRAYRRWVSHTLNRPELVPGSTAGSHPTLGYRASVRLPRLPFDVHIIGLDSSWLAGDDADAGKLLVTDDQVYYHTADDQGEDLSGLRLALLHHPLTDLADGGDVRRLLATRADLVLHGHLHELEASQFRSPQHALYQFAAGCLYEHDRYPNTCHVLTLQLDDAGALQAGDLWLRAWSNRGDTWFNDDGLYQGSSGGRLRWFGDKEMPQQPTGEPAPPVASPSAMDALSRDQQDELVDLLIACRSIRDEQIRARILERLDSDVASGIAHHAIARVHVGNIVEMCDDHEAIPALLDAVRHYEKKSRQMKAIDGFVSSLS